ncbi:T6SS immunity protein Tdi1 domain-containing protein [Thermodesulfobacteriota bacterium]
MELSLKDLTVNPTGLDKETFLKDWIWLMVEPMLPILVTAMGDVFAQGQSGTVYFVDTSGGAIEKVSANSNELKELLKDQEFIEKYFLPGIIVEMRKRDIHLDPGECYTYIQSVALEGESDNIENMEVADVVDHVSLLGRMYEELFEL